MVRKIVKTDVIAMLAARFIDRYQETKLLDFGNKECTYKLYQAAEVST